jgi:hypothetical protein
VHSSIALSGPRNELEEKQSFEQLTKKKGENATKETALHLTYLFPTSDDERRTKKDGYGFADASEREGLVD